MGKTSIEWTDHSWAIVNGCRRRSPGCGTGREGGCYAERLIATRLSKTPKYRGLAVFKAGKGPSWTGESRLWTPSLAEPLRLRHPRRIFVADMGDLFYERVSNEEIATVFGVMAACPQHSFQVLTKREDRLVEWFHWIREESGGLQDLIGEPLPATTSAEGSYCVMTAGLELLGNRRFIDGCQHSPWPLPNVHIGVSCETQEYAELRIPRLLSIPNALPWVSAEPMLGPIDLARWVDPKLSPRVSWIVAGAESGPGARPMDPDWARQLRDQCSAAGVPYFLKQFATAAGKKISLPLLDGRQWAEMPEVRS